jgi:hypothetical protein
MKITAKKVAKILIVREAHQVMITTVSLAVLAIAQGRIQEVVNVDIMEVVSAQKNLAFLVSLA